MIKILRCLLVTLALTHSIIACGTPPDAGTAAAGTVEPEKEMRELAARLDRNHRGGPVRLVGNRNGFAGNLRRTQSLTLDEDSLTLVKRSLICDAEWNDGSFDVFFSRKNRDTAPTIEECDQQRNGLKWDEKTERVPLAHIDLSSIARGAPLEIYDDPAAVSFVLDDNPFGFYVIECRDEAACAHMIEDLKRLAQLARNASAAPVSDAASQSAKSAAPSGPAPPESLSSRVAALMARINQDYRGAFSYGYLGDGESEVERATSVTLEKGFVLTWNHLRCVRTDRKYDVAADKGVTLARDCDRGVNGLAWKTGQTTIPLVLADSPFKVSGGEKSIRIVWTRPLPGDYEEQVTSSMSCKSPQACARMEKDLQEVLNLMTDTIAAAKARSKPQ